MVVEARGARRRRPLRIVLALAVLAVLGLAFRVSTILHTVPVASVGQFPTLCAYLESGAVFDSAVVRSYQPSMSGEEAALLERVARLLDEIAADPASMPQVMRDPSFKWIEEYRASC